MASSADGGGGDLFASADASSTSSSDGARGCDNPMFPSTRPFVAVEKACCLIMAVLFIAFNAIYWPWLLRYEEHDLTRAR